MHHRPIRELARAGILTAATAAFALVPLSVGLASAASVVPSGDAPVLSALTSVDSKFVELLNKKGITGNPEDLVKLGHSVCSDFADGKTLQDIVAEARTSSDLTDYQIGYTIGASVGAYCPEYKSKLSS